MKTNQQLIKNVIGQLEGVSRMMEEKKDCFETIVQMKAARAAMRSVMEKYIRENFTACASVCRNKKEKDRMEKLIHELIS